MLVDNVQKTEALSFQTQAQYTSGTIDRSDFIDWFQQIWKITGFILI